MIEALIKGTSTKEEFTKMQSEILGALQSNELASIQKAKNALKSVGKSEHSTAQSVSTEHIGAVIGVVSGEMKGETVKFMYELYTALGGFIFIVCFIILILTHQIKLRKSLYKDILLL